MDISHDMWDKFKDEIYPNVERDDIREEASGELFSPALYLKKYLSEEIGKRLTESLQYRQGHQAEKNESAIRHAPKEKKMAGGLERRHEVEVKDIQFAYKNHEVINLLK
jgi:hypothetical protein